MFGLNLKEKLKDEKHRKKEVGNIANNESTIFFRVVTIYCNNYHFH